MFTEAQNFALVQTELDDIFWQSFQYEDFPNTATAQTAELFKPMNISLAAYNDEVIMGPGLFTNIGETQQIPLTTPGLSGSKFTTYVKDFAEGVSLSKDLFDDAKFGTIQKVVSELAVMARRTQDITAFQIFRGAFTTTLTADGVSLINSAHPLLGGGTQSNIVTGALSPTTLYSAIVALRQQKNQRGVLMGSVPSILLVPTPLWKTATEVTDSLLLANTANNNLNVYRSALGIRVLTSPDLDAVSGGSDTAWFVLSRTHCVTRYIREGVNTWLRDYRTNDNREYRYNACYREAYSVIDHAGIVGSTGV